MKSQRWGWGLLGLLGVLYAGLAFSSLIEKSVTVDEFAHLPVGHNVLATGDFGFCELNPPFMNVLSAMPLAVAVPAAEENTPHLPRGQQHSFWGNGYVFMARYVQHYHSVYVAARCVTVVMVGLLGVLLFAWGRSLVPERANLAGLLAAGMVWFSPGVLAHARLVTTDAGAACFICFALWTLHRLLMRPTLPRSLWCGVALGLAELVKFTAVWLYPLFVVLAVVWRCSERSRRWRALAGRLGLAFAISAVVVNAGYLFQGTLRPLGDFAFESGPLSAAADVLPGWLPIPLPRSYVSAFDAQLSDVGEGDPSFLFGESYHGGRWYYFVALLAIKTPLPALGIAALAVVLAISRIRRPSFETALLLLPAITLAAAFSLLSEKQLGLRMILPAAPLFWLWCAVRIAHANPRLRLGCVVGVLLLWQAGEVARIHPDYLAYFNQFVGGPSQGHRYAIGANCDWGQDLIALRDFADREGEHTIQLLYFGRVEPALYGLDYTVPRGEVKPGLLAVSTSLFGRRYILNDHGTYFGGGPIKLDPRVVGDPIALVGHTIAVYRIAP